MRVNYARCVARVLCAACMSNTTNSLAAQGFARMGLDFGGDKLFSAYYANGDVAEIKAGELLDLSVGFVFDTLPDNAYGLQTQLSLGWKFDNVSGTNGNASWDRFPFELMEFVRNDAWRIGGGLTYHMKPKLKGDGVLSDLNLKFDDAWGGVVEADYFISDQFYFGGRYTMIDYTYHGAKASGDSVGVLMGFTWQ